MTGDVLDKKREKRRAIKKAWDIENSERNKVYRESRKEYQKAKYLQLKDDPKYQTKVIAYRFANRERQKKLARKWYLANREKLLKASADWYKKNRDTPEYKSHRAAFERKRKANDPNYRLATILRRRLNNAIKNYSVRGSAVKSLGCSVEEARVHIESKFTEGMTWDNYGLHGWHIDHIRPLYSFDLSDESQLAIACHFSNLQPLWAKDNLSKAAKLETPEQVKARIKAMKLPIPKEKK